MPSLLGSKPNQVSTNGELGTLAFQDASNVIVGNVNATGVTTVQAGTVSLPAITTTGDTNTGIFFPAADTIAFTEGGAESMRIDSSGNLLVGITSARANAGDVQVSKGISFPATQSAQSNANTLDDYEEGTWTPAQGAGLTVVGTFSSAGTYTKIGRQVTINFRLTGSTSIAASNLLVLTNNLPFTASAGNLFAGGVCFSAGGVSTSAYTSASTTNAQSIENVAASANIYVTITYDAA